MKKLNLSYRILYFQNNSSQNSLMARTSKNSKLELQSKSSTKPRKHTNISEHVNNLRSGDSIDDDSMHQESQEAPNLNLSLKLERDSYLKHIQNLRLAHKVQIKNEKLITINSLENSLNHKLEGYENSINRIFQKIIKHVNFLYSKVGFYN